MIFKHLFRSKHQSPDPQVRIQAIENLNHEDPEQKSILHELAFNDSDIKVSLAALEKLNSFALWYKMAEIAKNDRVQKKSQQFVEKALLDNQSTDLSEGERRNITLEVRDNGLIEKLLNQAWVQSDTELALALLKKLDKAQVLEKVLLTSNNFSLQKALLAKLEDSGQSRKLLAKIQKKTPNSQLAELASQSLQTWIAQEQLPKQLEQQCSMLLSRLLALKESSDLAAIQAQQQQLTQEYSQLSENFDCLSDSKRQEIEQKYAEINSRVERTIEVLLPKWQAQQELAQQQAQLNSVKQEVETVLAELKQKLSTDLVEISQSEWQSLHQKCDQQIEQLSGLMSALPVSQSQHHRILESLAQKLIENKNMLSRLPELQRTIQAAQQLANKFSELDKPNDVSQIDAGKEYLVEQKQLWRQTLADYQSYMPKALTEQWRDVTQAWQKALELLKKQVNADVARCRNKIKAVESLINQGKYKAAMGLYQKVQHWYQALPEKQQTQLSRSFEAVQQQIENLKDWQEYIAAPRKPALLEQVQSLIEQPLAIDAQAEAIKTLRYQWNSLGKTQTEADQALNEAFELAIEQAFLPCREHYDKQQQIREQNLANKQALLNELDDLSQQSLTGMELAKQLHKLQQQWRSIGEVDFKIRDSLYQQYQQKVSPIKTQVTQFYQANAEQKQQLVKQAQSLLSVDMLDEAIEQAKALQAKWKTVEHAGKKAESELYKAFREAIDVLFAQRKQEVKAQKDQLKQQINEISQQLDSLEKSVTELPKETSGQDVQAASQTISTALASLPLAERKALEGRLQAIKQSYATQLKNQQQQEKLRQLDKLFSCLQSWQEQDQLPELVGQLNKSWQSCFSQSPTEIDRHALCIQMEILAQVDSPKEDTLARQNIQMQMMAEKLQSGESPNTLSLLKQWISGGALNKQDLALLSRIEPLFVKS
ncbi:DUF349 domain-containing protein [Paraglaciecola aestuariivivens]